jgi:hypothetical protein
LPGVSFVFYEDGLYIIGEWVQALTVDHGQQRNERKERKTVGPLQYVVGAKMIRVTPTSWVRIWEYFEDLCFHARAVFYCTPV